jgi:Holliday junction DNA helicase RuvB
VELTPEGGIEIARRSRGTPRVALRLLRRVRDYAQTRAQGVITGKVAGEALELLDIDYLGLDDNDRRILHTIIDKYNGGPVGLPTIAASVGEDESTIEDVHEPYLMQLGFIKRTPRGREATALAYEHLGLAYPKSDQGSLF